MPSKHSAGPGGRRSEATQKACGAARQPVAAVAPEHPPIAAGEVTHPASQLPSSESSDVPGKKPGWETQPTPTAETKNQRRQVTVAAEPPPKDSDGNAALPDDGATKLFCTHRHDADLSHLRANNTFVWHCGGCAAKGNAAFLTFAGTEEDLLTALSNHYTSGSTAIELFPTCTNHVPELYQQRNSSTHAVDGDEGHGGDGAGGDRQTGQRHGEQLLRANVMTDMRDVHSWVTKCVGDASKVVHVTFPGGRESVVVNHFEHPTHRPTTCSFWFEEGRQGDLQVFTFPDLDPTKALDPKTLWRRSTARYSDGTPVFVAGPGPQPTTTGVHPTVVIAADIPYTEAGVAAHFSTTRCLRLRYSTTDKHPWFADITEQTPPEFAKTTAYMPEDKRTVLAVAGEGGIGKTKWVTEELPRIITPSTATPIVVTMSTVKNFEAIDRSSADLRSSAGYSELEQAMLRMYKELGRHNVTFNVSHKLFAAVPRYEERLTSAVAKATLLFEDVLQDMDTTYRSWKGIAEKNRRVSSHVLLVLDEVGANLNFAHALLSEPFIQRKLKANLFGENVLLETGEPLCVDLVLCGTGADTLKDGWQNYFSTDPGRIRLMRIKPVVKNATRFGNHLWSQLSKHPMELADIPLQEWVPKILSNPRMAHAFVEHLHDSVSLFQRPEPAEVDVANAISHAMARYVTMSSLGATNDVVKRLLIDVAYHELTFSRRVVKQLGNPANTDLLAEAKRNRAEPPLYLGKIRVDWNDVECRSLFTGLSQMPSSGVRRLDDYDVTGERLGLYTALCSQCVGRGLLTYRKDFDIFEASPALAMAVCFRFGQIVVPTDGDAFENLTCIAVERGLQAQGFRILSGVLSLPVPDPRSNAYTMISSSDDALQRARKHLTSATTNSPCAVVIKYGPSASAADFIVLSREVVKDAPDELRVMLIGCKHHESESWWRRTRVLWNAERLKWFSRALAAAMAKVGTESDDTAGQLCFNEPALQTWGSDMMKSFTTLVGDCASPGSTAVPKLSFILQESLAEMPKDLPQRAFRSCRVGIRDDLGLFAALVRPAPVCDVAVLRVPRRAGKPICPTCFQKAKPKPAFGCISVAWKADEEVRCADCPNRIVIGTCGSCAAAGAAAWGMRDARGSFHYRCVDCSQASYVARAIP